jgi:hypothetical protein
VGHIKNIVKKQTENLEIGEIMRLIGKNEAEVTKMQNSWMLRKSTIRSKEPPTISKDILRDHDGVEYVEYLSSASCPLDEIQSIMLGPLSARFWIYRKHMCCQENISENRVPFLAW